MKMRHTFAVSLFCLFSALVAAPACALPITAEVESFIAEMQAQDFAPESVRRSLEITEMDETVLRLIGARPKPGAKATKPVRSWRAYRKRFLGAGHIDNGVEFYQENRQTLERAAKQYGVPPEIIVGIIGVETYYGRNTGNFETLSALATLAFYHPRRGELFREQLADLFLLARAEGRSVESYTGSFAGAIGYPQFLPGSIRKYGVDFDGNGHIDLEESVEDAIGSVANYLASYGWQRGAPVAEKLQGDISAAKAQALVQRGIEPVIEPKEITRAGLRTRHGDPAQTATLVDLPTPGERTEYWAGYHNFYVITRYNRSSFYAMAVFQLAEAVKNGL
ncbi:MAG: lytic murein transglycosylase B [Rhodocyclaceae bacterium]|nr:lytic murein transglycosylase B [Rhodocyclaceae bacterium]